MALHRHGATVWEGDQDSLVYHPFSCRPHVNLHLRLRSYPYLGRPLCRQQEVLKQRLTPCKTVSQGNTMAKQIVMTRMRKVDAFELRNE